VKHIEVKDEAGAKIQIAKINLLNVSCRFEAEEEKANAHCNPGMKYVTASIYHRHCGNRFHCQSAGCVT
jgi:uncharacterized membrane protein